MSENPIEHRTWRRAPWVIGLIVIALVLAFALHGFKHSGDLKSLATGSMAKLKIPAKPGGEPDAPFFGPNGQTLHLADFKGQVVVANFWATWCAPCVQEMPTLAKLQAAYAGKPLKVVAVSVDSTDNKALAQRFLLKHGPLEFYHDPQFAVVFGLEPRPEGVPVTVIYDKNGHEQARLEGSADWNSPEAKAVLDSVLAQHD